MGAEVNFEHNPKTEPQLLINNQTNEKLFDNWAPI